MMEAPPLDTITLSSRDFFRANWFLKSLYLFDRLTSCVGICATVVQVCIIFMPWKALLVDDNDFRSSGIKMRQHFHFIALLAIRIFCACFTTIIAFQDSNYRFLISYLVKSTRFSTYKHPRYNRIFLCTGQIYPLSRTPLS
jgi:hypothetical protein